LQAAGLYALPALPQVWTDGAAAPVQAVAGSALAVFGDRVPWAAGAVHIAQEHDRAAALLNLAVRAARAGEGVDAALALPIYLRDKVAQTTQEREALRFAASAALAAQATAL
jgi:tRNA threonylcarbamoyladenosine biosynthesis protein TsaB